MLPQLPDDNSRSVIKALRNHRQPVQFFHNLNHKGQSGIFSDTLVTKIFTMQVMKWRVRGVASQNPLSFIRL